MKKLPVFFCLIILLIHCQRSIAQKISIQERMRLYKSPAYWKQRNLIRFRSLPPALQNEFNARNAELKRTGQGFSVGPTWRGPVRVGKSLMRLSITDTKQLPLPKIVRRVREFEKPCLEILAQPTDRVVDMRDYGIVTQVRMQGGCGCCWDFATVAAFETSILLQNGYQNGVDAGNLALSEQQVLNCTGAWTVIPNSCGGGSDGSAASYIQGNRIATFASYPYQGSQQNCTNVQGSYQGSNWGWLCSFPCMTPSNEQIKSAICQHGSVVSSIQATSDFENFTVFPGEDSVFSNNDGAAPGPLPFPNHVIQIVGWNDNVQAWLIKNSWDTTWGEGGFAYVRYGVINIGTLAMWIDAQKTNNACSMSSINNSGNNNVPPPSPTLIGAVINFDNSGQGMESQDNYWIYLYLGHSKGNNIGSFSYANQNQGYNTGQLITNQLNLSQTVTLAQIGNSGCLLELDRHGQFGGFHNSSDWNTGITIKLLFSDGEQIPVTWAVQNMHCDNGKPFVKWLGNFSYLPNGFRQLSVTFPAGFYIDPYQFGDHYSTTISQSSTGF